MKKLYLTLTFLLPLFGGAVFAQTGMTVFGDCYVSETASIGFFGDELTLQASVQGEGKLVMAGNEPQTLTAHDQAIDHLVIANPTVVRVKGKLTVSHSLIIEQGTLEVLPLAQLYVNPSTRVILAEGCKIIHAGIAFKSDTNPLPATKLSLSGGDAWLTTQPTTGAGVFSVSSQSAPIDTASTYPNPALKTVATPPWRV